MDSAGLTSFGITFFRASQRWDEPLAGTGCLGTNRTTGASHTPSSRHSLRKPEGHKVRQVCRASGIRMPDKKADYILRCFEHVTRLGGPEAAKAKLLAQSGREAKIAFLQTFPGIGPKYARNIMMEVYHEDFRDSIALDIRIKAISVALGLSFESYAEHEAFYVDVAREAGLNGWELDRLLFNFRPAVEAKLGLTSASVSRTSRCR